MLRSILAPFILGTTLAYALDIMCRFFEGILARSIQRKTLRRGAAIVLTMAILMALFVVTAATLIPRIADSGVRLLKLLPLYIDKLKRYAAALPRIPGYETLTDDLISGLFDMNESFQLISGVFGLTRGLATGMISSLTGAGAAVTVCMYLLICKDKILNKLKQISTAVFPLDFGKKLAEFLNFTNTTFRSYILGQITESLILGILCFAGLSLSGMPYALLIACVIGITNMVPILGPLFGVIPCFLILFVINPVRALWFLTLTVALQQLENSFIYPRVVGSSVGLPAIITTFAVFLGARIAGVSGAFLAVPIFAVVYRYLEDFIARKSP